MRLRSSTPAVALLALCGALGACSGGSGGAGEDGAGAGDAATDGGSGDGADGATDGADGTGEPERTVIRGTVRTQLYELDDDGDIQFISWPSSYAGAYPFGATFIGAVRSNLADADSLFVGSGVVDTPSPDGDAYEVAFRIDQTEEVLVYGAVDYWGNRIIHSTDPLGSYSQELTVRPGEDVEGVDFTILVPYTDLRGRTAAQAAAEDQSDERTYCDDVTLSGQYNVEVDYFEEVPGDGMAMLYTQEGEGPFDWDEAILSPTGDGGGTGTYEIQTCADLGYVRLVGRWDNNLNGIYERHDLYGAFASTPGEETNPVAIATTTLTDLPIETPIPEDSSLLGAIPFVRLSGTIGMEEGFDSLPTGSSVVIAATRYRMEGSIDVEDFPDDAYAFEVFEWPQLTGQAQVSWSLVVPANTMLYLWGFADEDGDGLVNEEGEAVVSGGDDDNGRLNSSDAEGARNLILTDFIGR